jgi:hypothetical protein
MNSLKPLQWVGIVLGVSLALYFFYSHMQYFGDVSFLGGILLLEVIIASFWKYDQRFFVLLVIAFVWSGMYVPLQGSWTTGRWLVLSSGAVVGCIVWTKTPRKPFGSLHLIAFFCICAAFVSASVSAYIQMASLKALSLLLLFLYCATGARLAVLGREDRFFRGLIWGSEIAVYITAICYFALGESIWGNPNSLGAAMSIGVFPILLWGWFTSFLPAPVQIAGEGGGAGSVAGCGRWSVSSRILKPAPRGPEGCRALQGAQGGRRARFAANTLGKVDRHDQRASVVWNGVWHESDGRGSRIAL